MVPRMSPVQLECRRFDGLASAVDELIRLDESRTDDKLRQAIAAPRPQFVAVHCSILQGARTVARAISKTMAKRIANALNRHIPNREGI